MNSEKIDSMHKNYANSSQTKFPHGSGRAGEKVSSLLYQIAAEEETFVNKGYGLATFQWIAT